jgi:hypothetical protein
MGSANPQGNRAKPIFQEKDRRGAIPFRALLGQIPRPATGEPAGQDNEEQESEEYFGATFGHGTFLLVGLKCAQYSNAPTNAQDQPVPE